MITLLLAATRLAANPVDSPEMTLTNICHRILGLLGGFQSILLEIGSAVIILAVIFAGFKYITGDAKGGKGAIMAAIVGTLIVLLSYTIVGLVISALGASERNGTSTVCN